MYFEPGGIYHIYNQGNNRQQFFFERENYLFFVRKIKDYVTPYGNILAWCLMPNHFHLMLEVINVGIIPISVNSVGVTKSRPDTEILPSNPDTKILGSQKPRPLNNSIGIMLRSYTRAVNNQENRSGNLFREETKSICLNEINGIASNWFTMFGATFLNVQIPEYQYPQVCFDYIHANPIKSKLVEKIEDWEFSSFPDLKGFRESNLANVKRVKELGLIV